MQGFARILINEEPDHMVIEDVTAILDDGRTIVFNWLDHYADICNYSGDDYLVQAYFSNIDEDHFRKQNGFEFSNDLLKRIIKVKSMYTYATAGEDETLQVLKLKPLTLELYDKIYKIGGYRGA